MTIEYYRKNVFGQRMYYFADGLWQHNWNSLTGRKTITLSEMNVLAKMFNCNFTEVIEP